MLKIQAPEMSSCWGHGLAMKICKTLYRQTHRKQEVDIGFMRKEIQLYDMLLERVHVLKLQESAMSVAKKTATKVHCRQTQADRYTWGQIKKYVWFWLPDLP